MRVFFIQDRQSNKVDIVRDCSTFQQAVVRATELGYTSFFISCRR